MLLHSKHKRDGVGEKTLTMPCSLSLGYDVYTLEHR